LTQSACIVEHLEIVDRISEVADGLRELREILRALEPTDDVVVPRQPQMLPQVQGLQHVEHAAGGADLTHNVVQHADERDRVAVERRLRVSCFVLSFFSAQGSCARNDAGKTRECAQSIRGFSLRLNLAIQQ